MARAGGCDGASGGARDAGRVVAAACRRGPCAIDAHAAAHDTDGVRERPDVLTRRHPGGLRLGRRTAGQLGYLREARWLDRGPPSHDRPGDRLRAAMVSRREVDCVRAESVAHRSPHPIDVVAGGIRPRARRLSAAAAGHLVPGWTVPGCGTGVRGRGRRPGHWSLPRAGRRRRAPPAHASRGPGTARIAGLVAQRSSSRVCVVFTRQLLRATAGSRRDLHSGGSAAPALAAALLYDQRSRLESRRTVRDLQRSAGRVLPPLASGDRRCAPARPDRSCGDRGQRSRDCSGWRPAGLFEVHR